MHLAIFTQSTSGETDTTAGHVLASDRRAHGTNIIISGFGIYGAAVVPDSGVGKYVFLISSSGLRSHERPLRHSAMATTGRRVPVAAR